ncbi:MAG: serine/threonine protein kinase [Proteobacteria bacterium]|nr:serine/threonine protein kinase [Pseudomonadota bacterium]
MTAEHNHPYQVLEIVAAGTFGQVCIVQDVADGRPLAVKVLKKEFLRNQKVMARTRDEARLLSVLDHPNLLNTEGFFVMGGHPIVAMEWVQGIPLSDLCDPERPVPPAAVSAEIIRQCSLALDAAYTTPAGPEGEPLHLVHRDIKPGNILISVDGDVKVVDFGIAKGNFQHKEAVTVSVVLGARDYNAPERLDGDEDQPSLDVYSLGCTLYRLLGGTEAFISMNPNRHSPRLEEASAALALDGVRGAARLLLPDLLQQMCAYDPTERPSHREVVERIEDMQTRFGLDCDLRAFAAETVAPLYHTRGWVPPTEHPAWPDVAFLEAGLPADHEPQVGAAATTTSGDVDARLRVALSTPEWPSQVPAMRRLLAGHPRWDPTPLVTLLREASAPAWQLWKKPPPTHKVAAALELLRGRNDAVTVEAVRGLIRHKNPEIAASAQALLDAL